MLCIERGGRNRYHNQQDDRHAIAISGCRWFRATWAAVVVVLAGCGGKTTPPTSTTPVATVRRLVQRDSLVLVEAWGAAVADTTLMIAVDQPRVIILRHGPPDNTVFAELSLPAHAFESPEGDSVRVSLSQRPGTYGVHIASDAPIKSGAVLVFKYAYHFSRPDGAERYATTVELEEALFVGRLQENGMVAILASTRPASDNLQAVIPAGGNYVVAALR